MKIIELSNNIIDNIIHISDLHFTIKDKYSEYSNVFDKFIEKIKEYPKDKTLVIITGDIFNEKNKLESKLVSFVKKYIYNISSIHKTFIITGNHDLLSSNRNIPDSITSVFFNDNLQDYLLDEVNNIYYLKNTGYYIYNNIGFGVLSIFDILDNTSSGLKSGVCFPDGNEIDKFYIDKNIDYKKVALLHTTVKDSLIQSNDGSSRLLESYENHISIEDINNYDYIMLGDVHKFQYIENACYPSSLVQQNFGEDVLDHGFVIYNLKDNSRNFVRIYSDFAYVKCKLKYVNKKIEIDLPQYNNITKEYYPKNLMIRLHIDCKLLNDLVDIKNTKDDLLEKIKKWFSDRNLNIRNMELIFENENKLQNDKKEFIIDKSIDWTSIDTIKKYVNEQYPDDYENIVKELNNIYEVSILEKSKYNNLNWRLKLLEWSNMFCYGENNKIDFTKEDVNLIIGNNYSGKSSIIDILLFCIYGNTYRIDKIIQVINNNKKDSYCSLTFEYGDDIYKIERFLKKKKYKDDYKHSQKIYVKKIKSDTYENIIVNSNSWTGEKLIETPLKVDDFTNKVFGKIYNFMSTYIVSQNNQNSFIYMKNTERKELIESWLNLDYLEEIRKIIKNNLKNIENDYLKLNTEINTKCEQKKRNMDLLDNFDKESLENKIKEIEKNINEFNSIKIINKPEEIFIDYKNNKINLSHAEYELNKLKNENVKLKNNIIDVSYKDDDLQNCLLELNINKNILKDLEKKINMIISKIKIIKFQYKEYKDESYYIENIESINSKLRDDILEYFKTNYIPPDKEKNFYIDWLKKYNNFLNDDLLKIKSFFNLDNLSEIKYIISEYENQLNKSKENFFKKEILENKLKYNNTGLEINELSYLENIIKDLIEKNDEIWKTILYKNLKSFRLDKNDNVFFIKYYETIEDEINKKYESLNSIKKEELNYKDFNYELDIEFYKKELKIFIELEKNLSIQKSIIKNIHVLKFKNECSCCNENRNILKYDEKINSFKEVKSNYDSYVLKYKSVSNLDNIIERLKSLIIVKNDKENIINEIQNLKLEKENYFFIKKLFNEYKDNEKTIELYTKQIEYIKIKEEIDSIFTDYSLNKENEFNNIKNIVKKYIDFEKEKEEWNIYIDKYEEYENMKKDYKIQHDYRNMLNEIQNDYEQFKKYNEYVGYSKEKENLNSELDLIKKKLNKLDLDKKNIEKNRDVFLTNIRYINEIKNNENNIESLELKILNFKNKYEKYKEDLNIYNTFMYEYNERRKKYELEIKDLVNLKVKLETYINNMNEYNFLKKEIDIKKIELFNLDNKIKTYEKLELCMSLNGYNYWIYKNIVPILNDYVNDILKNIVDFSCDIRLEYESNKTAINIFIKNSNSDVYIPIKLASGFQNQILNIVLRLCLIRLNNSVGNVMFMDESFVSFDINFQNKIPELVNYFNNYINKIYIISHHNELDKYIKGKYIIEKQGLYSVVKENYNSLSYK